MCILALVIRQAKHIFTTQRYIFVRVLFLPVPYFSTLSHKWHDIAKKVIEQEMCFDILCDVCPKHFSLRGEFSETLSQIYIVLHVKYPLFLSEFNTLALEMDI